MIHVAIMASRLTLYQYRFAHIMVEIAQLMRSKLERLRQFADRAVLITVSVKTCFAGSRSLCM